MAGYVYRCYDSEGVLLYIGCTINVSRRIKAHMKSTTTLASHALGVLLERYEVTEYPTRDAAAVAERDAIRAEQPLLNRQHVGEASFVLDNRVARYMVLRGLPIESAGLHYCGMCGDVRPHNQPRGLCWFCREVEPGSPDHTMLVELGQWRAEERAA